MACNGTWEQAQEDAHDRFLDGYCSTHRAGTCVARARRFSRGGGGKQHMFAHLSHYCSTCRDVRKAKDQPTVGQPDQIETVGPKKWAGPVSVQLWFGPHSLFGLGPKRESVYSSLSLFPSPDISNLFPHLFVSLRQTRRRGRNLIES